MEFILEFIKTDIFLIIIAGVNILLLLLFIISTIRLGNIKKEYKRFMKKLGNGSNMEQMLKDYIDTVKKVETKNQELTTYCHKLDKDITNCIQRVGIVRYSAFKDVGSDLSFAAALLDENNNGIVLNGIYSSEASNIYAKPVTNGTSTYTVTEEEKKAIEIAMNSERTHKIIE